jgi:hypothetical protein
MILSLYNLDVMTAALVTEFISFFCARRAWGVGKPTPSFFCLNQFRFGQNSDLRRRVPSSVGYVALLHAIPAGARS